MRKMLKTDEGLEFKEGQSIFPIIVFIPELGKFKCIGTGFFITPLGGFVTARHVLFDNNNKPYPNYYGVQRLSNDHAVTRVARDLLYHPNADIALGMLYDGYDGMANKKEYELAPSLTLSFKTKFAAGDKIATYGYPNTELDINNPKYTFNFLGNWSEGSLIDILEESPIVKNKCFQTTMHFDSGASGGPVFKDGKVIGINSSSMDLIKGEDPISFVTPINYLLNMKVKSGEKLFSIKQLVEEKYISGIFD
jgi:S1-C subfamily serine protease